MKRFLSLTVAALTLVIAASGTGPGQAQTSIPQAASAPDVRQGVAGIAVPDSPLARAARQTIRDAEGELMYQHSMRVYYWAALAGQRKGLSFDPDLLYVAALFHDYGLTAAYGESHLRFEVDGANAARDLLRRHGASEADGQAVWQAIALHTTNGISPHLSPLAALLAEGANMDLIGAGYDSFSPAQRDAVVAAYPREPSFAEDFMQGLYDGLKHRPEATQGTGLADVMAYKDRGFTRRDFSKLMRASRWKSGQ
jgi:hypothetical protein